MIRAAIFTLEEVIPFIFTSAKRHELKLEGYNYTDLQWINTSKKMYPTYRKHGYKTLKYIEVSMGSHRYQMFADKGTDCVKCGIKGEFFALERDEVSNPLKFHFNLYGLDKYGNEVMITKDHIIPRSKGGKNILINYQPLCYRCNKHKANHLC